LGWGAFGRTHQKEIRICSNVSRHSVEILQFGRKMTKMFDNKFSEEFPVSFLLVTAKLSLGNGQIVVIETDGNFK
jgi:hypothetical protein